MTLPTDAPQGRYGHHAIPEEIDTPKPLREIAARVRDLAARAEQAGHRVARASELLNRSTMDDRRAAANAATRDEVPPASVKPERVAELEDARRAHVAFEDALKLAADEQRQAIHAVLPDWCEAQNAAVAEVAERAAGLLDELQAAFWQLRAEQELQRALDRVPEHGWQLELPQRAQLERARQRADRSAGEDAWRHSPSTQRDVAHLLAALRQLAAEGVRVADEQEAQAQEAAA